MKYILILLILTGCSKNFTKKNSPTINDYSSQCEKLCKSIYNDKLIEVTEITEKQICCSCKN